MSDPSASAQLAKLIRRPDVQALLLVLAAFAIRGWQFGNAAIQVDEEFYLLVGDRMWHGLLPYVDIWDRKPLGLFLIYAAIRGLGGDGVIQYQIVATGFAAATAFVVARMATRIAPPGAAIVAGLLYLLSLGLSGGNGGQSPVFYNLPVAAAAWILLRVVERPDTRRVVGGGAAAMALLGLAMQIKPTAVFEGCYFGMALLVVAWAARWRAPALIVAAIGWIAIALLPSIAAWAWYVRHGDAAAYDFANFASIFLRTPQDHPALSTRLLAIAIRVAPLIGCAIWGWRIAARPRSAEHRLLFGWAIAAIVGVLAFGTYYDHYALPLYAPLCVVAAPVLDGRGLRLGRRRILSVAFLMILATAIASAAIIHKAVRARGDGSQLRAIAAYLHPRLHDCLFVFAGEPILYYLTNTCLPTRWAFPSHLADAKENDAIGVDPLVEVRRIMAGRPQYVIMSPRDRVMANPRTWAYMLPVVARDYRLVYQVQIGRHMRQVMERRPGR